MWYASNSGNILMEDGLLLCVTIVDHMFSKIGWLSKHCLVAAVCTVSKGGRASRSVLFSIQSFALRAAVSIHHITPRETTHLVSSASIMIHL